jgi:L-rhamnose mutarotase
MKRYALTLDLQNDPAKIDAYEKWHQVVWPEIIESIKDSGIETMDIYRVSNRLFMIIEAQDSFTFQRKSDLDNANPHVQEWEKLMWQFQQPLPFAEPGEKWVLMKQIFTLPE